MAVALRFADTEEFYSLFKKKNKLLHLTKKTKTKKIKNPTLLMPADPPFFSTATNGSRMLCHYIQKQDNLKRNGCPLQCQRVQPRSARPELQPLHRHLPHSLSATQGASGVCLSCFALFTNYRYVQPVTQEL